MRKLTVHVLALALSIFVWSAAAQAAPLSGDTPKLSEFRLYFLHLANLDAAADKADAEGTPGDTAAWRRFEQENAGLTETDAALLKDVAFRCNRTLEGELEGLAPMEIVRQAVDELRTVLGPSAFEAVSRRIQTFLRPAITNVPAAVQEGDGEEDLPVDVEALAGPSFSVYSLISKLQDGSFMAQCGTYPNDNETLNQYAGGVTMVCEVRGGELTAPVQVPCGSSPSSTTCSQTYPAAPANRTRILSATHGVRMKLVSNVCQIPFPVYYDPLAFCRIDSLPPHFFEDGDVFPRENGTATCYDPEVVPNVCRIATTGTAQISWIYISPKESTVEAGGTVKFSTFLDATWSTDGPGTITRTGTYTALYTAPATVTSEQTVTIKGCDAAAPGDCDTATVTLKPSLQVQVTAKDFEVLPDGATTLAATVTPAAQGQELEWTRSPAVGTLTASGNTATYKAPANDTLPGAYEITVKACLKPAGTVCGTAKVLVPKIQMFFNLAVNKDTLALDERIQLIAVVHGPIVPRTLTWQALTASSEPQPAGELIELSPADNYARIYQAPSTPMSTDEEAIIIVKACIENTEHCATQRFAVPRRLELDAITSDTGRWQSGTKTFFTITGKGFVNPAPIVALLPLTPTVTLVSPTSIRGWVILPASAVPGNIEPVVAKVHPNDYPELTSLPLIPVEPAALAVTPPTATSQAGQSLQFTATCTTSSNQPCTSGEIPGWTALPVGTVSPAAGPSTTYTAPATVSNSTAAAVTACWNTGAGGCAAAQLTVLPPAGPVVTVSPKTASLQPGQTQQFTALVTNHTNTAVTWSILPATGTITQSGLYTAPATFGGTAAITVTATSQADTSRKDTATVTLVPSPFTLASTASPATVNFGTTVAWTATASGGTPPYQYALFRKKAGTTSWIPALDAPVWQTGSSLSWATAVADAGTWEIRIGARDANTPVNAPVLYAPGNVQVVAPPTLTVTPSPESRPHNDARLITWTATASGGVPGTYQYAFFRRRTGATDWIPSVSSPNWQTSNSFSWDPTAADVGTWDTYVWLKDSATPANMYTYGYAAGYNSGPVTITAPLCLSATPSPASVNSGTAINWTATPCGGYPPTTQFALFRRRVGATAWIPDVTAPVWQSSNVLTWTPNTTDTGAWEISLWVRDDDTPPSPGYGATYNPGNVLVETPPSVTGTSSPAAVYHGNAVTWTATGSGGTSAGRQYALFRLKSGTSDWIPSPSAPAWQTGNVLSWTPSSADVGSWTIVVWYRDANTPASANGGYGYAAYYVPGIVQVYAHPTVTGTGSPGSVTYGTAITWTATGSGGTGSAKQYAFFRKKVGTSAWIPAITSPAWQPGNVMSWTPGAGDVGTWETSIWMKDADTPPTMNGYGYAAYYTPGLVEVIDILTLTSTPSPALADYGTAINWTATANGGTGVGRQYALFRKRTGTTTWIPSQSTPAWQPGNVMSWTPGSADGGTWDILLWVKDSGTTSAYGASYNPGSVQVVAPLSITGTSSPAAVYHGNAVTWTATGSGGTGAGRQYALFRLKSGTSNWIPSPSAPAWQSGNFLSWTPSSADVGSWTVVVWFRDANTPASANGGYGFATYYNPGPVQVYAHPSVTGTGSPGSVNYGTTITWTATGSGGTGSAKQYAFFRKKVGTSTWIPAITSPAWQPGNVMSWTPGAGDVGTWETSIWMKDADTPPTMNGYGHAAYYTPGLVEVVGPLTLSCSGSPVSSTYGNAITWTANASGGHTPTIQYAFFRRRSGTGDSGWIPAVTSPAWQAGNTMTWTPTSSDVGSWDIYTWVRDGNTPANMNIYGYAAGCNSGSFQVTAPLGLSGTGSPSSSDYGNTITWTAYASGGYPPTTRYALFRRPSGSGTAGWIPSVNSPAWQTSNVMSWTPTSSDAGSWDIYIWVKDGNTPANMNVYGYAAGYNAGSVEVTAPVYQSHAPIGYVDGYDRQHVWGWACDPDYPVESNRVDFWSTAWQFLGSADAYSWSSSPINSACGGGSAHYFDFYHNGSIPPGTHFWVWSIDLPYATEGNVNVPIGGNGAIGGNEFVMP
ncbi:MAG: hypothetical protein QOH06_3689 [Acidobacteriota bacterium]|jgi:hypothetical protein|nr:hypothetical protein [Acidobacteriota bacterium]